MRTILHRFRNLSTLTLSAFFFMLFVTSCSKDDPIDPTPEVTIEEQTVKDLDGFTEVVYFDFEAGKQVDESATSWDLAFNGTTLSFGNGAIGQIVEGAFDKLLVAPSEGYTDKDLSGSGSWYRYTMSEEPIHAILPSPGKIIVLKTHNNKYVKIEMLSYYKGNPDITAEAFKDPTARPNTKVYTFVYSIQKDGTVNFK